MEEILMMYAKNSLWDAIFEEFFKAYEEGDQSVCFSIDNETGRTLLHLAVASKDLDVVENLVHWFQMFSIKTKGEVAVSLLINTVDYHGKTPLDIADDPEIGSFLQEIDEDTLF